MPRFEPRFFPGTKVSEWASVSQIGNTIESNPGPAFAASGGTESTSGGYKYHKFLTTSALVVTGKPMSTAEVFLVGGAGAGGGGYAGTRGGGGGGGSILHGTSKTLSVGTHTITVGGGGAGAGSAGATGTDTSGLTVTATGGTRTAPMDRTTPDVQVQIWSKFA